MKRITMLCLSIIMGIGTVQADRYDDLMAKWAGNGNNDYTNPDAMNTAWVPVPKCEALLEAYVVTGTKKHADDAHAAVDYFVRTTPQPNPNGLPAYLVLSVISVTSYGTEIAGEEFRHLGLIAHFIEVVRNHQPALAEYNDDADHYLRFIEDTMMVKWMDYIIDDTKQEPSDYFYPGAVGITQPQCTTCTPDPYDSGDGVHKLLSNPNNKQCDFGKTMLRLWRITGKDKYKNMARGVALNFKSKWIWNEGPTGRYYSWHYWDPIHDKDFIGFDGTGAPRFGVWIEHRAHYGNIDMEFVTECYREGIVFCRDDIQRLVRTNRDIMWDGITTDLEKGTWLANDGNPAINYGGLYQALAPYDTTGKLTDLLYNYYNVTSTGWNALLLPLFVKIMHEEEPPDTVTWQGPLEMIKSEPLNKGAVRFTFYNEVDPATITDMDNFAFSRGITALSAAIDGADARMVTVYTTDQTSGASMRVRIRNVKDIYGNTTFAYMYGNQPYSFTASDLPSSVNPEPAAALSQQLHLAPLPAAGTLTITSDAVSINGTAVITVSTPQGQQLLKETVTGLSGRTLTFPEDMESGLHILQIDYNNTIITKSFMAIGR